MSRIGDRGELEAFVRAVELGSFSAAARQLGLTPSGISKLVTRLEAALRVRLLNRTTRRVAATPEGELFLARCRRVLAELEDAESEIGMARERPRGRIRVHIAVGFAMHQVVDAMPRFFQRHPEVQVELLIEDRRVDLARESIDISVRPWPPESDAFIVRKLFEFERTVCAAPAYLEREGIPRTPEELLRHRCLTVSSIPTHALWRFRLPTGDRDVHVTPTATVNNADCVYRFALAGLGIARLNEFIVAEAIRDGRLVPLLEAFRADEGLAMRAIYTPERHRLPRVAAMVDFLTTTFASRPWRRAAPRKKGEARGPSLRRATR
jgi:DNA-binding transcriptional LysR family regulator